MSHTEKAYIVKIRPVDKEHSALGLGCWVFGGSQWGGQKDEDSTSAMQTALELGITHWDTASGYGAGHSERLVGDFLAGKREQVFLASKFFPSQLTPQFVMEQIEGSLKRLKTDYIDLYYIHWPSAGNDMRPVMEGLEKARSQGKILSIGVSNFSVEQMEQVSEVGQIDAHQFCYNLFWRFPERDIIPYCRENGIAVVTYSSIAQGALTGKFPRQPQFREGDQRSKVVFFHPNVWPFLYEAVEELKQLAAECGRTLTHLAIRWALEQPGVTSVLVGARDATQMQDNAAALEGDMPQNILDTITAVSDRVLPHVPNVGHIFNYRP